VERVLVLGGNFAGLTSALEAKRHARGRDVEVKVVSKTDYFLYVPSMIWVPFREREVSQITRPVPKILGKRDVAFQQAEAVHIDPERQVVTTTRGEEPYDYLVIATGPKFDYSKLEGSDPKLGFNHAVHDPELIVQTREDFDRLVADPGPVVVGAAPGASCIGAAYEFLFNVDYFLRKHGVRDRVDLTWVTPEPYAGHFGMDGIRGGEKRLKWLLRRQGIRVLENTAISSVSEEGVTLADGTQLPSKFTMIMPAFSGQDVVLNSGAGIGTQAGFIPVNAAFQHPQYPNIFSAGVAIDVEKPFTTQVPLGIPKTGFPADIEGKIVGKNIGRLVNGRTDLEQRPFRDIPGVCVMDAGHKEVIMYANKFFPPRQFEIMLPNPFYDITKRFLERYFLFKEERALAQLP
jgi:sulfide:quinone oxidoreductase